jgi:hypothetical protein
MNFRLLQKKTKDYTEKIVHGVNNELYVSLLISEGSCLCKFRYFKGAPAFAPRELRVHALQSTYFQLQPKLFTQAHLNVPCPGSAVAKESLAQVEKYHRVHGGAQHLAEHLHRCVRRRGDVLETVMRLRGVLIIYIYPLAEYFVNHFECCAVWDARERLRFVLLNVAFVHTTE